MNKYKCFGSKNVAIVYAESALAARDEAAKMLKEKKAYNVTPVLVEKNGKAVNFDPCGLPGA